jgi:hypothetical protein
VNKLVVEAKAAAWSNGKQWGLCFDHDACMDLAVLLAVPSRDRTYQDAAVFANLVLVHRTPAPKYSRNIQVAQVGKAILNGLSFTLSYQSSLTRLQAHITTPAGWSRDYVQAKLFKVHKQPVRIEYNVRAVDDLVVLL